MKVFPAVSSTALPFEPTVQFGQALAEAAAPRATNRLSTIIAALGAPAFQTMVAQWRACS